VTNTSLGRPEEVKRLRELTGAGIMDCKAALEASGGDFDKAVIKPEGKSKLDDLSTKVRGINLEVVIAIGHADSIGSDAYNQRLSVRRAEAVKAYMVSRGVEPNRVYTEGKGEKQPVTAGRCKRWLRACQTTASSRSARTRREGQVCSRPHDKGACPLHS
jgi:outer membrane protein OmpA-like peptidoglycan-associated protein